LVAGNADSSVGSAEMTRHPTDSSGFSPLHSTTITARLVVAGTTELDTEFYLSKETNLLGRSDPHTRVFPEVDLSKYDPHAKVSRRHARIWREGSTFLVEDLGSVNGTIINELVRLAPRQPRVLESGDKIRLGETTLHFMTVMPTL
ncbi:MAG: FHA domain-containing protein, partial [Pyrinomonadaceae bacterium]